MSFTTTNPFTNTVEKTFPYISDQQLKETVEKAYEAQKKWRQTPLAERAEKMERLAEVMQKDAARYSRILTLEMGKLLTEGMNIEIPLCVGIIKYYARHGATFLKEKSIEDVKNGYAFVSYEPLGLILGIMPWNFPYYQVIRFASPNLFLGNAVLVKHAANVPQSALMLEEMFQKAGFPEGVYTNLFTSHEQTEGLIASEKISGVSLTGSSRAGKHLAAIAGKNVKKCVMELGGSDPTLVLDDADLDLAAQKIVAGRMICSGQACSGSKRLVVEKQVFDKLIPKILEKMQQFVPGDPMQEQTNFAPVVHNQAKENLAELVQDAVQRGATILYSAPEYDKKTWPGSWMPPTIVTDITPEMRLYKEEAFGPVLSVYQVDDLEEAIKLANDTEFGLSCSIFTRDIAKAQQLGKQIESGMVYINTFSISEPELPFGGIKASGFGREMAGDGMLEFANKRLYRIFSEDNQESPQAP